MEETVSANIWSFLRRKSRYCARKIIGSAKRNSGWNLGIHEKY